MGGSARLHARRARTAPAPPRDIGAPAVPDVTGLVLLDADAAVSCPVRTHNRFDPAVPDPGPGAR